MNNTESAVSFADALLDKAVYSHPVDSLQLIETHISWVILTGKLAYKIKKPVNFGFLDFSTLAKRKFCCEEEIRLNRRLAEDWYIEVVPITGSFESPKMNGAGRIIDYAVMMKQFPAIQTLRQTAVSGRLTVADIDEIGRQVAEFHNSIEKAESSTPFGESSEIKHWFDENFLHIKPLLQDRNDSARIEALASWGTKTWESLADRMLQRKVFGFIRECHGDLHTGNMIKIDEQIVLFDCIEFNPMLRWIDVMSEAAFFVMDLMQLGYDGYAFRFLNRYLERTGDYNGLVLLRYYLVYRALVRAKVALLRNSQTGHAPDDDALIEYRSYAELACRFIDPAPLHLIITHGFSGSGKSTFAGKLAEKFGAIHIRSDIERKRMLGFPALAGTQSEINESAYSNDATEKTYSYLAEVAQSVIDAGFSVIVDATFLKSDKRNRFKTLAEDRKITFTIIDFQVPVDVLKQRIERRRKDPSEATLAVLESQLETAEPLADNERDFVYRVTGESDDTVEELAERLKP